MEKKQWQKRWQGRTVEKWGYGFTSKGQEPLIAVEDRIGGSLIPISVQLRVAVSKDVAPPFSEGNPKFES